MLNAAPAVSPIVLTFSAIASNTRGLAETSTPILFPPICLYESGSVKTVFVTFLAALPTAPFLTAPTVFCTPLILLFTNPAVFSIAPGALLTALFITLPAPTPTVPTAKSLIPVIVLLSIFQAPIIKVTPYYLLLKK